MERLKRHLRYARTVARHKWYVFLACRKLGITWRGIIHDWSKFLPSEWFVYARHFEGEFRSKSSEREFDVAWLKHIHRQPHHWEHWVLIDKVEGIKFRDSQCIGESIGWNVKCSALYMPAECTVEMVADWAGASRAYSGNESSRMWYAAHKDKMMLHPETRAFVETLLKVFYPAQGGNK